MKWKLYFYCLLVVFTTNSLRCTPEEEILKIHASLASMPLDLRAKKCTPSLEDTSIFSQLLKHFLSLKNARSVNVFNGINFPFYFGSKKPYLDLPLMSYLFFGLIDIYSMTENEQQLNAILVLIVRMWNVFGVNEILYKKFKNDNGTIFKIMKNSIENSFAQDDSKKQRAIELLCMFQAAVEKMIPPDASMHMGNDFLNADATDETRYKTFLFARYHSIKQVAIRFFRMFRTEKIIPQDASIQKWAETITELILYGLSITAIYKLITFAHAKGSYLRLGNNIQYLISYFQRYKDTRALKSLVSIGNYLTDSYGGIKSRMNQFSYQRTRKAQ